MTRTPTIRRALAGACALTLLLAACGDDDGSGEDDGTEETTTTSADDTTGSTEAPDGSTASEPEGETPAGEGDPEAVATAEAINLTIDDFADGWTAEEDADDDDSDDIDQCFTTVDLAGTTVGEAETPTFSAETPDGQGAQVVSMQTIVFDSPETASTVLSEASTGEFATCVQGTVAQGTEGASATLVPVVDDPPLAEESVGLAGTVDLPTDDGGTQQGRVDLHMIRSAQVVSMAITLDIGATPATGFEQTLGELYALIADRQAAEVG